MFAKISFPIHFILPLLAGILLEVCMQIYNVPAKLSQVQAKACGYSDHKIILATRHAKNIRESIRYCKKRSYKNFDEKSFLEEVAKIRWWEVHSCMNVDMAVDIFTKKLTDILDRMAPVKKFQVRTKYAAWLSKDSKDLILKRDKAYQLAYRRGLDSDWTGYKQLRNQAISQIKLTGSRVN